MGRLTTHVLDLAGGRPAAGVKVELWSTSDPPALLRSGVTNADGRLDSPLLDGPEMQCGTYELRFHAAAYFRAAGADLPDPPFIDIVPIRFGIGDASAHVHVPLLLSPYGYSTYRGS